MNEIYCQSNQNLYSLALQEKAPRYWLNNLSQQAEVQRNPPPPNFLGYHHPSYPQDLKILEDPPLGIFYRGDLNDLKRPKVAIVGTRKASRYGRETTRQIAYQLASQKVTIISGLAYGIDQAAHQGAIEAKGITWSVLAGGVHKIYPQRALPLVDKILGNKGLLLSEYPDQSAPKKWYFPARNRLIAALCDLLIVVEAPLKSGTLHTVNFALELGKTIFVVPGPMRDSNYLGSHQLISDGANLLYDTKQILEHLAWEKILTPSVPEPTLKVSHQGNTFHELIEQEGIPEGELHLLLCDLLLKNQLRQGSDGRYYPSERPF